MDPAMILLLEDTQRLSAPPIRTFQAKSSNQKQVSIQGHRYTKTRGAYAHCLLYASSAFRPGQASGIRSESTVISIHSIQVKLQGSGQVFIPSRSSFKVQVKVNGFRSRSTVSVSNSIQVKHQGSDQSPWFSCISNLDEQLLICFCIFELSIPSRSSFKVQVKVHRFSIHSIQVKRQGPGQGPRFSGISNLDEQLLICFCIFELSIPSRSSFKVQVKVHRFRSSFKVQVKVHGFQVKLQGHVKVHGCQYPIHPRKASMFRSPSYVSAIQVKCQGPDFPAMAIDIRRQGCDLPAKCSVIQVNQQDSDLPSMVIAIDVRRQGSDLPAMVIVFSHPGQSTGF
ncbi:hypothetical protein PHYBLDRAFT_148929 [Phycomyces blakesleeanus NRRL 1555(-)]|uniref:Uncharacterized protein n=1 Tax=Phycomyces blakesleeanus (strain ATCC 8743b / DSM 1359 / FGSC 10004 / NBRC 33097 / NRRL 1555) TaxID=763407 RepID=A0A163A197_PHYB8|nr:hypothetical protein PHYBLDRAFT_148929 [Phycomyces blakesleeanus NRRL 1555(-)]OAD70391.1 hypothetical protein PHYBLDRAFT_148929 [Phycomyces blakesleeanus NRRL 1555(-)]|eukprot:XP_018288431.1 hypothetical protein PHYBLDRAFT_148929 [Phycomyces blakesleeanus NRRL 1555(-)]